MAGFLMKQMVGNKLDEVTGGLNRLGGDDENKTLEGDDPEVFFKNYLNKIIIKGNSSQTRDGRTPQRKTP